MTSLADRTIAALRTTTDSLLAAVDGLTDEQLAQVSGSSEWTVAQVLSHLGSGSELGLLGLQANLAGDPQPEQSVNEAVWARWNAMTPREQATEMPGRVLRLTEAFEALTPEQREGLQVQLAFLPFPLPVAAVLGMRLTELALHTWDVEVAFDPSAVLREETAVIASEQVLAHLGFMLGFTGKPGVLGGRVVTLDVPSAGYVLELGESVSVVAPSDAVTATFGGSADAAVRLLSGRLREDVPVTGNVTLDELHQVFPGY